MKPGKSRILLAVTIIAIAECLVLSRLAASAKADVSTARREAIRTHNKMVRAWQRRNLSAYLALLADDFVSTKPDGTARSHAESVERIRSLFRNLKLDRYRADIQTTEVHGHRVDLNARVRAAGTSLDTEETSPSKGKWLPFSRDVPTRYTYVHTASGWKLQRTEVLPGGVETYNGKRINLDAPPLDPLVKEEIQVATDGMNEAFRRKDLAGIMAYYAPDSREREVIRRALTKSFREIRSISLSDTPIEKVERNGSRVVVVFRIDATADILDVEGHYGPKGQVRHIVSNGLQQATWEKREDGWKTVASGNFHGTVRVDGKLWKANQNK